MPIGILLITFFVMTGSLAQVPEGPNLLELLTNPSLQQPSTQNAATVQNETVWNLSPVQPTSNGTSTGVSGDRIWDWLGSFQGTTQRNTKDEQSNDTNILSLFLSPEISSNSTGEPSSTPSAIPFVSMSNREVIESNTLDPFLSPVLPEKNNRDASEISSVGSPVFSGDVKPISSAIPLIGNNNRGISESEILDIFSPEIQPEVTNRPGFFQSVGDGNDGVATPVNGSGVSGIGSLLGRPEDGLNSSIDVDLFGSPVSGLERPVGGGNFGPVEGGNISPVGGANISPVGGADISPVGGDIRPTDNPFVPSTEGAFPFPPGGPEGFPIDGSSSLSPFEYQLFNSEENFSEEDFSPEDFSDEDFSDEDNNF